MSELFVSLCRFQVKYIYTTLRTKSIKNVVSAFLRHPQKFTPTKIYDFTITIKYVLV